MLALAASPLHKPHTLYPAYTHLLRNIYTYFQYYIEVYN